MHRVRLGRKAKTMPLCFGVVTAWLRRAARIVLVGHETFANGTNSGLRA
jgi:hypothetical protein